MFGMAVSDTKVLHCVVASQLEPSSLAQAGQGLPTGTKPVLKKFHEL
jgi:hypothetical protein